MKNLKEPKGAIDGFGEIRMTDDYTKWLHPMITKLEEIQKSIAPNPCKQE